MRPTRLTRAIIAKLADAIASGASYDVAARSSGIAASTFYKWRADARAPDCAPLLSEFSECLAQAEAEAERRAVAVIWTAMEDRGDWKAAAWWLERRRAGWNIAHRVELDTPDHAQAEAELQQRQDRLRTLLDTVRDKRHRLGIADDQTPLSVNGADHAARP